MLTVQAAVWVETKRNEPSGTMRQCCGDKLLGTEGRKKSVIEILSIINCEMKVPPKNADLR